MRLQNKHIPKQVELRISEIFRQIDELLQIHINKELRHALAPCKLGAMSRHSAKLVGPRSFEFFFFRF